MSNKLFTFIVPLFMSSLLIPSIYAQSLKERVSPVFQELRNNNKDILTSKSINIESINIDSREKKVIIAMPKAFSAFPFRHDNIRKLYDDITLVLPDTLHQFTIAATINGKDLDFFIPNYFRQYKESERTRTNKNYKGLPLVRNECKPYELNNNLNGKHIAIWSSHGSYFEPEKNCWQWQRPKLYGITEDSYTASLVIPYLLPMLDNAGAITMTPKERDTQSNEVIVDNDDFSVHDLIVENSPKQEWTTDSFGFSQTKILFKHCNPFLKGTVLKNKGRKNGASSIQWIPTIPSTGEYAVYVSYKTVDGSTTDAHYTVFHSGGETSFSVNQTMGGSTWIYLGKFKFKKGRHKDCGKVVLTNRNKDHGIITADAVRFGGGLGNVARSVNDTLPNSEAVTSGLPKYLEAARYWLQWAGFPDSVYNVNKGNSEYKDDYMSRALWVNNLAGGSVRNPGIKGKNIPLDAAIALHSDAGTSSKDNIIGSLAIYMTNNYGYYSNGVSRMAARDLSDLIQTQVVEDISKIFHCNWTRRQLTDESYYEARVPEVPTLLFESLSHQNFQDMKYGLDPHFRFIFARAVYKGILKYFSSFDKQEYIVQPLPVTHFSAEFYNNTKDQVYLTWKKQVDELEPTANPTSYIVYTSKNDEGFDNGVLTTDNHIKISISPDTIYNFKVTALNDGGESFPSEILSVAHCSKEEGCALIVNGFERIAGPLSFNNGTYQGFLYNIDMGVPYKKDISHTGNQYDFKKNSEWITNENPGIGASYGNYQDMIIAGNTFNYPSVHGKAILGNDYSFVSCSVKALEQGNLNLSGYSFVDMIFGKQKETVIGDTTLYNVFTADLINVLSKYLKKHGNLLITGQYIASDVINKDECDSSTINFIEEKLHYTLGNIEHKSTGAVSSRTNMDLVFNKNINYYFEPNKYRYHVTCPDILLPVNQGEVVLRHNSENAAGIMYKGNDYRTVVSSIPFETIKGQRQRKDYMRAVIDFFKRDKNSKNIRMVTLPTKSSVKTKSYVSTKRSYKQDFYNNHK